MLISKRIGILITILIVLVSIFLINKHNYNKSTITKENVFHIDNTSSITRIFLSDREGNIINLVKENNNWIVNEKFKVRNDAIITLLSTIKKIRIKNPVSNSAYKNVIKYISTTGINVEIFKGEKMIKSYIIGSNTPNHLATYMIMKNNNLPYAVHIPGFNGFLSPRYGIQNNILSENLWRSRKVFDLNPKQIKKIKYSDFNNIKNSYLLTNFPIKVRNYKNNYINFDSIKVQNLLNSFKKINCEAFKKNKKRLTNSRQIEELIINDDTLRTFQISDSLFIDRKDNYNVKRKFATLNNGDLMLIQDYVFNKILISIDEIKK